METTAKVKTFFDHYVEGFDSIYQQCSWIDRWFRQVMKKRFERSLAELSDDSIKTVLDIGCGTGRYTLALAKMGKKVIALDVSPNMVEYARELLKKHHLEQQVTFLVGDYLEVSLEGDGAVLTGFFDYIENPLAFLKKLKKEVRRKICMTFPRRWHWLSWQRQIRYKLRDCPLFFYTQKQIERLLQEAQMPQYRIKNLGRDFFVVVEL